MLRDWIDTRDGTRWRVRIIPLTAYGEPNDPHVRVWSYRVHFARPGELCFTRMRRRRGLSTGDLSDEEIQELLDVARTGT